MTPIVKIRPIFTENTPRRILGIKLPKRVWLGEPIPKVNLSLLVRGDYDCKKSKFTGYRED